MKKKKSGFSVFLLILVSIFVSFTSCDLFPNANSNTTDYDDKMEASTGKWQLFDDQDTYFVFDGSENVMTFSYYEDNELTYSGKYRAVYRANPNALSPLTFVMTRSDKSKEDWINCYVENFEQSFTQFSIICEEEDLGVTDGTVYSHIYRISEIPYKMGTYILENNEYKAFSKTGFDDGTYRIPEGTYATENDTSFMVVPLINRSYMLFQYINEDTVIEGIFNIAEDRKTIYLYIEHDIYQKIRNADKKNYDTTFSINYPPDFYLRGDFDTNANNLVINGLYHHDYSPTEIEDSVWVFGTYVKK